MLVVIIGIQMLGVEANDPGNFGSILDSTCKVMTKGRYAKLNDVPFNVFQLLTEGSQDIPEKTHKVGSL